MLSLDRLFICIVAGCRSSTTVVIDRKRKRNTTATKNGRWTRNSPGKIFNLRHGLGIIFDPLETRDTGQERRRTAGQRKKRRRLYVVTMTISSYRVNPLSAISASI